jgi:alanine racemase
MKIATLPIGYGDGYPRSLSNKSYCLISGQKARIIGRICMDQLMVDVTKIKEAKIGQESVLIGRQKNKSISVEELASLAGTIPYEIVCNLGGRLRRVYQNTDLHGFTTDLHR